MKMCIVHIRYNKGLVQNEKEIYTVTEWKVYLNIYCLDKLIYWVTQKLKHLYTVIFCICIGKVALFAVYICGNLWGTQYIV